MDHRLKSKPLRRMEPNLDMYMVKHWGMDDSKSDLTPHKHFKNGEWNQYRIVARGPRIQTWVNGNQVPT